MDFNSSITDKSFRIHVNKLYCIFGRKYFPYFIYTSLSRTFTDVKNIYSKSLTQHTFHVLPFIFFSKFRI